MRSVRVRNIRKCIRTALTKRVSRFTFTYMRKCVQVCVAVKLQSEKRYYNREKISKSDDNNERKRRNNDNAAADDDDEKRRSRY